MKIYGDVFSGNCHKLKLACELLGLEYQWVAVDIMAGETRNPDFLAMNPNGQIPVCLTDDGEVLAESNAILYYLARDSELWPQDRLAQTRVLEWQFFEQYSHEPSVAVARFINVYLDRPAEREQEYQARIKSGYRALDLMEKHLESREFLVGESCSIADISLYAYTGVAHEGGFDMSAYRAIRRWIANIEAQPGFVGMPPSGERQVSSR